MSPDSKSPENAEIDKIPSEEDEQSLRDTPVMGEADLERSGELSLECVRPPLQIPGYEQAQFLGRGAFGEVWKAIDSNSGRTVAIKFYSHRGGLDWSHMTREVEKLQYLFSDRNVVQLFDVGWDSDPPYYIMEYMAYGSLEDRLREGPMTIAEAVKTIREIAVGLSHAHDKGVLHCDLKPGNIMLDQDGRPRLADFGQARLKHEHAPALGTLFYMAPEQASLSATPNARWDVYALGAILYRMTTGELPYSNEQVSREISSQASVEDQLAAYAALAKEQPKPDAHRLNPGMDRALIDVIDGCLHANPLHRFPNVQSVLHALDLRENRKSQRPLLLLGLVAPTLVVLLLALAGTWIFQQTIETASEHLLARTGESNLFGATSVADRFGLEVDKRWRILEQEASHPRLRERLESDTASSQQELQQWLQQRQEHWREQFTSQTAPSYWFILDRKGKIRAISPLVEHLIGSYFGHREYFHGQGRELNRGDPVPVPISEPHRSNVFRSQPDWIASVAFSVPIGDESSPPIGVFALESEMGRFAEFEGSRNQLSVLVDLRIDQDGKDGLIVEHPALADTESRATPTYLPADQLRDVRNICTAESESDVEGSFASSGGGTLSDYVDPLADDPETDRWLASVAPVQVVRGDGRIQETDWAIIIQERTDETLAPLKSLGQLFFVGGLASLGLAILIVGGLWWIVLTVANAPGRLRSLKVWNRTTTLFSKTAHATNSLLGSKTVPQSESQQ